MRVLVTGGTGFIGSACVRLFRAAGHDVYVTGRPGENDVGALVAEDYWAVPDSVLRRVDVVCHQQGITDPQCCDFCEVAEINHTRALEFFARAVAAGVQRFVYASSCSVYGNRTPRPFRENGPVDPRSPYACSKLALDVSLPLVATIPVVGLRYSNVYGPGEGHKGRLASMVYQIGHAMTQGQRPRLFRWGEQVRDWVHVDDVARANLLAAERGSGVYNIGHQPRSFRDVVGAWNHRLSTAILPEWIDCPYGDSYQTLNLVDCSRAEAGLGWLPQVRLTDAVTPDWFSPAGSAAS